MKKGLIAIAFILLLTSIAWAGMTSTLTKAGTHTQLLTLTWTNDNITFNDNTTSQEIAGHVLFVVTNPGTPAPVDNYDIEIKDSDGVDILGGEGANRDNATSEQVMPKIGSSYGKRFVKGPITLSKTNDNNTNSTGVIKIYIGTDAEATK